jgi:hypothetical protein
MSTDIEPELKALSTLDRNLDAVAIHDITVKTAITDERNRIEWKLDEMRHAHCQCWSAAPTGSPKEQFHAGFIAAVDELYELIGREAG